MKIIRLIPKTFMFAYIFLLRHSKNEQRIDLDIKAMEKKYKKEHRKPCKICGSYECDGNCMKPPKPPKIPNKTF